MILCIRTDKPISELYIYDGQKKLAEIKWEANRALSTTLHSKIDEICELSGMQKNDLSGIVVFEGPGSFTGLRIGFSVANAMAHVLQKPIVAASGKNWVSVGIDKIILGKNDKIALPEYGSPAHTTLPKK